MLSPEMKEIKNIMGGAGEFCPRECRLGSNGYKEMWYLIWDLKDQLNFFLLFFRIKKILKSTFTKSIKCEDFHIFIN